MLSEFMRCLLFHCLPLLAILLQFNTCLAAPAIYIGTYTAGTSKGIYRADWDPVHGVASNLELAAETSNPSFLAAAADHHCLYAVGEMSNVDGKGTGAVSGFAINPTNGLLSPLNQVATGGSGPCHVSVDAAEKFLLVANYGSGSIAGFPIESDGLLGKAATFIQHRGSSLNHARQSGPHAHFIITDPKNRYALTCDLGLDKILTYPLNPARTMFSSNASSFISIAPGSGPRHLAFSSSGNWAFAISEMSSTVTLMEYDSKRGRLREAQTISTLPENFSGHNSGAEIQAHPAGKFVYASNRGHDSIAVFEFNSARKKLTRIENVSTGGKTPRHFALDPAGHWLLAENQDSGSVVTFEINQKTGKLTATGNVLKVGSPVCLVFVP
jgi:6-phosphogluconolactonase